MAIEVAVDRELTRNRPGSYTPASWTYRVAGPDGHQFSNDSIAELRRLLKRRYGADVQITQNWEGPARPVRWSDLNSA